MEKNISSYGTHTYTGILESIIFSSPKDYFTIAKLRCTQDRSYMTIVGYIMSTNEGEEVRVKGTWVIHPKYGKQFKVDSFEVILPTNKEAIEKYLASGIIKGIGPSLAKSIVKTFGEKTFEIFDENVERILEVPGIGKKKYIKILDSWKVQRDFHEAMLFLSSYSIRGKRAVKICEYYGGNVFTILKEHPYRLAIDINGIGFMTADQIARKIGIEPDDPERLQAGLLHIISEAQQQGHCYLPQNELLQKTVNLLCIDNEKIKHALEELIKKDKLLQIESCIYSQRLYFFEKQVAKILQKISKYPISNNYFSKIDSIINHVENILNINFVQHQKDAVKEALFQKISIITGGPGVGKTTIVKALVTILLKEKHKIALVAPTGRAAKKLSQVTGYKAKTIHRFLQFNPQDGQFIYNKNKLVEIEHLIIDEVSMLDIILAYQLLSALPENIKITFVGDADQLPSVGPGNFLGDIILSEQFSLIKLTKIFRQAYGSTIVDIAHCINSGCIPRIQNRSDSDIFFIHSEDTEKAADLIVNLISTRLPNKYGFKPATEIQVLTPMYRGNIGADNLNQLLADHLNPHGIVIANKKFRVGDKVMQIVNNYEKEVYNGDIGIIASANRIEKEITINFDGHNVAYDENEMDELVRAYAISIHKSQGSEYPAVVLPLFTEHYIMLERNLLYTAITRGKELVVIVGNWKALTIAVNRIEARKRYTRLATILRENISNNE